MYLLINWNMPEDLSVVRNEDGSPMYFDSKEEAEAYGKKELNWNWKVISV